MPFILLVDIERRVLLRDTEKRRTRRHILLHFVIHVHHLRIKCNGRVTSGLNCGTYAVSKESLRQKSSLNKNVQGRLFAYF